jgi:Holliday junction resolvase-like predicted endonuclease
MNNWHNKIQVKKGNLGEKIVLNILEQKGYIVYQSITNKAHTFDFLAIKDKKIFKIAEIKSKARLNKFDATGINIKNYKEYVYIYETQKIDTILFFVDEHPKEKRIYCQQLSELMKEKIIDKIKYPNTKIINGIILFSLNDMIHVKDLSDTEINELKNLSLRKYDYE